MLTGYSSSSTTRRPIPKVHRPEHQAICVVLQGHEVVPVSWLQLCNKVAQSHLQCGRCGQRQGGFTRHGDQRSMWKRSLGMLVSGQHAFPL